MPLWVNRTTLSGSSVSQNGTTSHTCTFTPAAAGNFLVAVLYGGVTFTTPTGWTLPTNGSIISSGGLYLFTRTATAGLASFTTTHNGSNYGIIGVVYEFPAGTTFIKAVTGISSSAGQGPPALTGMTGTYSAFGARAFNIGNTNGPTSLPMVTSWTKPPNVDLDAGFLAAAGTTDSVALTIAYEDGATAATYTPVSSYQDATGGTSAEQFTFALNVGAGPAAPVQNLLLMF